MPTTLSGDNVSLSMVKPIFILSGETTTEANLVWFLKDVLFSQNILRSGLLVRLYPSHNWLSVLNQLKIVSLSMANKTLPSATTLFLSADREGFSVVVTGGLFVVTGGVYCDWSTKFCPRNSHWAGNVFMINPRVASLHSSKLVGFLVQYFIGGKP